MIVCAFDEQYWCWGKMFICSLRHFHPRHPVVVVGVDLNREHERELRMILNVDDFVRVHVSTTGADRPAAIANSRPYWFRDILQRRPGGGFLMDADLLVRQPLSEMFDALKGVRASLVFRDGVHQGKVWARLQMAAGLVGVGATGIEMVDEWIARMESTEGIEDVAPWSWFWEQTCLNSVVRASMRAHRYHALDPHRFLCSQPFRQDAAVWSANVARHLKDAVYEEFRSELMRLTGRA